LRQFKIIPDDFVRLCGELLKQSGETMKISIISGSHRNPSQSEKVARHVENTIKRQHPETETWLFTLADNPLPLWDQSLWEKNPEWDARLAPLKRELAASDGFVIVSPEWHGQVPAGLKNFFLLFSRFELGHKPALIVTVSSGDGGAYPVAELRMSSYKNNRICYIPEQVVVRHVEKVLNDNAADNIPEADGYFRERIEWALDMLQAYAVALKSMRETTLIHHDSFGNGM
jgi:NAD(P)H-dependent FMN reductase